MGRVCDHMGRWMMGFCHHSHASQSQLMENLGSVHLQRITMSAAKTARRSASSFGGDGHMGSKRIAFLAIRRSVMPHEYGTPY